VHFQGLLTHSEGKDAAPVGFVKQTIYPTTNSLEYVIHVLRLFHLAKSFVLQTELHELNESGP